MNKNNDKLQIRNSTAEFLIFTSQTGSNSIEVMVVDENVWLTQDMIATLYEKGRSTITEHCQWATSVLKDFSIRGYVMDKERLKNRTFLNEEYFDHLLEEIRLTPTEFKILKLIWINRGIVFSTEKIFERIWGKRNLK